MELQREERKRLRMNRQLGLQSKLRVRESCIHGHMWREQKSDLPNFSLVVHVPFTQLDHHPTIAKRPSTSASGDEEAAPHGTGCGEIRGSLKLSTRAVGLTFGWKPELSSFHPLTKLHAGATCMTRGVKVLVIRAFGTAEHRSPQGLTKVERISVVLSAHSHGEVAVWIIGAIELYSPLYVYSILVQS